MMVISGVDFDFDLLLGVFDSAVTQMVRCA